MSVRDRLSALIDRSIEIFAPRKALERQAARKAAEQFSDAYQGARMNRVTNNWDVTSASADSDLLPDLPLLRERSRELVRNDPHAASVVGSMVDNIVGAGIRPQSAVDATALGVTEEQAEQIRRACEAAWERWTTHADVARRMTWNDILAHSMRSLIVNGEAFLMPVRIQRIVSPYDLALEVIEPDRIEYPNNLDDPNGRFNRRSGIELGRYGYPAAYWVRVSHPGDGIYERTKDKRHRRIRAITEDGQPQFLHLMNCTRPGQTRGEPMLSPALQTFKDLSSYTEAVLTKERVSACHTLFIQRDGDPYSAAVNGADATVANQRIHDIEPGMVSYLAPGESVTFGNPAAATSASYDSFIMRHLRSIGAALGLPYELVAKDFSQTNYSSARAALLESRRVFTRWQTYLIDHLCRPIYAMVIEEAYLRGEIPVRDFDRNRHLITRTRWVPPSYGFVDPKKEMEAAQIAIDTGLSSLAIEAAAQGRDWQDVADQRARERDYLAEIQGQDDDDHNSE